MQKMKIRHEPGTHVKLQYMDCPCCAQLLDHPIPHPPGEIGEVMREGLKYVKMVQEKAKTVAKIEGLEEDEALRNLAFFECFKCKVPYYGGRRECA
jgi:hypothetical protein